MDNEDQDWTLEGDLGLGLGLKPGGIPNFCSNCLPQKECDLSTTDSSLNCTSLPHFAYKCKRKQLHSKLPMKNEIHCNKRFNSRIRSRSCSVFDSVSENSKLSFKAQPRTCTKEGVTRSRSCEGCFKNNHSTIKQQISLDELSNIFFTPTHIESSLKEEIIENEMYNADDLCNTLHGQIKETVEAICVLENKLEVCKQLLLAKYQACEILVHQLTKISEEKKLGELKNRSLSVSQEKQINKLQYELECIESQLRESQRNWLEKFTSVSHENIELSDIIKIQREKIKKITAEKLTLRRERDELFSAIDAKERLAYHRSCSISSEDGSQDITALEIELYMHYLHGGYVTIFLLCPPVCKVSAKSLGILGACTCRGPLQEPCMCAEAACARQKYIRYYCSELQKYENLYEESFNMVAVYREAFEEQLKKNRHLTKHLSDIEAFHGILGTSVKTKLWKRKQNRSYSDIINALVDLLCDKNEALIHQRIVSKILAKKLMMNSDLLFMPS